MKTNIYAPFWLMAASTSLGRPGQPAELLSIYVQLAASDASYATGQVYGSAGGSGQPWAIQGNGFVSPFCADEMPSDADVVHQDCQPILRKTTWSLPKRAGAPMAGPEPRTQKPLIGAEGERWAATF